jgi:signal transduction histidine kinase/AmiR/NasT family two-component response regulator
MSEDSDLVLVLAPNENDSNVAAQVLRDSGIQAATVENLRCLCAKAQEGCAVLVIAEEALPRDELQLLEQVLRAQEPWSDVPVILLTGDGPPIDWESFSASGNISILERPFSRLTLVRAVEVGLRARKKQYQVRQLLKQQQQATQKRDDFFATLSHELRTPLNVILGWIEILHTGELSHQNRMEALAILERNAKTQKALIDDLLDVSRIITGKLHFQASVISLTNLLGASQRAFLPRAEEKNIFIELNAPQKECLVLADEQRLTQVISNLLTNAIKFTPEDGNISINLTKKADNYLISIRDSGQGIDAHFLPYVFDSLKQEDMSTTRSHGGLGLGLAIAAHIVEQHQGKIFAKSEGRNKGSEFIVTIPAFTENTYLPTLLPETPILPNSLEGVRILVVDDSPDILELIKLWLKKANAEVKLTQSAAEALQELPRFRPDVLLSDIGMPGMDGYQLISKVRLLDDPALSQVRAVALTAYAKDEERTKALSAGFQLHISKPISNKQLIAAVSQLVRPSEEFSLTIPLLDRKSL